MISPNPTNGQFAITITEGTQSPFDVEIIDSHGKQIFEQHEVYPGEILQSKNLSQGFYTVLIKQDNQLFRKKLIIQ